MSRRRTYPTKTLLPLIAFVAPTTFDATAQNVNIHQLFSFYDNVNKAYGYTFSDSYNTLTLSAVSGVSYRYGYTRAGIDYVFDVTSATNPFTASTDTKRWVIVNNSATGISGTLPTGAVWGYIGSKCTDISSTSNTYLKYIHIQSNSITNIPSAAFNGNTSLSGILTIPNSVTSIGSTAFYNTTNISGNLVIPSSVTSIGLYSFVAIGSSTTEGVYQPCIFIITYGCVCLCKAGWHIEFT